MPDNLLATPLPAANLLMMEIRARRGRVPHPFTVAIDGRSGTGKSTIAAQVAKGLNAALIPTDDFYAAGITDEQWNKSSPEQRALDAIDWRRLVTEALEPLRAERGAAWLPFDFGAGPRPDGTWPMKQEPTQVAANPIIIVDGAYSSRPELAGLLDYTVLVEVAEPVRLARLAARETSPGFLTAWHQRWDAAEDHYFTKVRPASTFHLVVNNKDRR